MQTFQKLSNCYLFLDKEASLIQGEEARSTFDFYVVDPI